LVWFDPRRAAGGSAAWRNSSSALCTAAAAAMPPLPRRRLADADADADDDDDDRRSSACSSPASSAHETECCPSPSSPATGMMLDARLRRRFLDGAADEDPGAAAEKGALPGSTESYRARGGPSAASSAGCGGRIFDSGASSHVDSSSYRTTAVDPPALYSTNVAFHHSASSCPCASMGAPGPYAGVFFRAPLGRFDVDGVRAFGPRAPDRDLWEDKRRQSGA